VKRARFSRLVSWADPREPVEPREPSGPVRAGPIPPQLSVYPADKLASRVLSGDQRTARWVGPMFAIFAVILVGWIAVLAITLPERGILHNEDLVWVGFDIGLLLGLTWTAWAALRRKRSLPLAAAATGASLITDAWFDVVGSDGHDRLAAIAMAVVVELPLSAFCWWLAMHSQELAARRVSRMILWWRQVEGSGATVVPASPAATTPAAAPVVPAVEVAELESDPACEPEPPLAPSH
jgi:hypothetical protein